MEIQKHGEQGIVIGLGKELFVQIVGMEEKFKVFYRDGFTQLSYHSPSDTGKIMEVSR